MRALEGRLTGMNEKERLADLMKQGFMKGISPAPRKPKTRKPTKVEIAAKEADREAMRNTFFSAEERAEFARIRGELESRLAVAKKEI